jgi:purine catabolism regulator
MPAPRTADRGFPHVTVEDVWRGALPPASELAAGRAGLRREVAWCTALRPRAPAFEPFRGGELVLVDPRILPVVDPRLNVPRLLESLAEQGIAGVVLAGRAGAEARAMSERHGLPLLCLPVQEAPRLDGIAQQVLRYIVDRRTELHERTQDLHRQLSEIALAGRGLDVVLARLTELVGVPVVLERGNSVDYVTASRDRTIPPHLADALGAERAALDDWLRDVPLSAFDPPVAARSLPEGRTRLVAPILVQGTIAGFLSLIGKDGELGELHRLAVGRAANACAIELVRAQAARHARDEVEEELLDVLSAARPGSRDAALDRARRQGVDLESSYLVVAGQGPVGSAARLRTAWERSLHNSRTAALVRVRGEVVVALVTLAGRRPPDPRAVVSELQRAARGSTGAEVALGYGSARSGTANVALAVKEAEQSLSLGRRLFGSGASVQFQDLGLYRLLSALQPLPELRAFHEEVLGRLQSRDRAGVLRQTLKAYLDNNGSPTETAERLHLHRNTVLYRLGRIQSVLGQDLRDAEVRLTLHLALKIENVLEQQPGRPA